MAVIAYLDRVQGLLLADLFEHNFRQQSMFYKVGNDCDGGVGEARPSSKAIETHLHLGIGPSWNLDDHVQDSLLFVGVQGDVVEWGDWNSIFLEVDAMLQSVGSSDLASGVLGSHVCGNRRRRIGGGRRGAREVSSYLICARRNFVCIIGWRQCGRRERERERLQVMAEGGRGVNACE